LFPVSSIDLPFLANQKKITDVITRFCVIQIANQREKIFSKDLQKSQVIYHRWISENNDNLAEIIIREKTQDKHNFQ